MPQSVALNLGQSVLVGPITGLTDTDQPAPINQLGYSAGSGVSVVAEGVDSYRITGLVLGTVVVSFVAKNAANQLLSDTVTVNTVAPVATKLNIPISPPQG